MTTDLIVPSKRPRAPSFSDKHPDDTHTAALSDCRLPDQRDHHMAAADHQVHLSNFLDLCRFCKKTLRPDQDVFMYGYLGAFCSKECRAKQMACDIFMEFPRRKVNPKKGRRTSSDEALDRNTASSSSSSSRFYI
ncbi:PREDICTED: uncharacterized protein LOC104789859 [Camelina sativa]|uniref:Uncharacterized protein LOC104789859 n=1 Tax=Camelina sativa TaxID=90675 RepID=A0ABM0ZCH0_CAMSA|nr:PREDICTED: uncharacterized protein LOC104789859 [Camelina sativa]